MNLLISFLVACVVSAYYFPFSFSILPGINTKMMLALAGILLVAYRMCSQRGNGITFSKELLGATGLACLFSLTCLLAVDYNSTGDYSYALYIVSFFTWLGGAYTVCAVIRMFHGKVTLSLLSAYLAFVCTAQCISAILIDRNPSFQQLVDSYISQGQEFTQEVNRLYGIGAALDTAGVRFSIVLLLIAHALCRDEEVRQYGSKIFAYLCAFFIISVLGNMVSRTTSVGVVLSLVYMIYSAGLFRLQVRCSDVRLYSMLGVMLLFFIILFTYLYQHDSAFNQNMHFAFEAFFNWIEGGEFRTSSTDKLNGEMWIWPDNLRGWVIGTGLFDNFVYGTDIGYCRFILYCGILGFVPFILFFVYNAWLCARKFSSSHLLAVSLLALSFIIWIKVATDLFIIYALFYCLDGTTKHEIYNQV